MALEGEYFITLQKEVSSVVDRLDDAAYSFALSVPPYMIKLGAYETISATKVFCGVGASEEIVTFKVMRNTGAAFIQVVDDTVRLIKQAQLDKANKENVVQGISISKSVYASIVNPAALFGEVVADNFFARIPNIVELTLAFNPVGWDFTSKDNKIEGYIDVTNIAIPNTILSGIGTEEKERDLQLFKANDIPVLEAV